MKNYPWLFIFYVIIIELSRSRQPLLNFPGQFFEKKIKWIIEHFYMNKIIQNIRSSHTILYKEYKPQTLNILLRQKIILNSWFIHKDIECEYVLYI